MFVVSTGNCEKWFVQLPSLLTDWEESRLLFLPAAMVAACHFTLALCKVDEVFFLPYSCRQTFCLSSFVVFHLCPDWMPFWLCIRSQKFHDSCWPYSYDPLTTSRARFRWWCKAILPPMPFLARLQISENCLLPQLWSGLGGLTMDLMVLVCTLRWRRAGLSGPRRDSVNRKPFGTMLNKLVGVVSIKSKPGTKQDEKRGGLCCYLCLWFSCRFLGCACWRSNHWRRNLWRGFLFRYLRHNIKERRCNICIGASA